MEPFGQLTAIAAPIELRNVNTDMIFPARFMRKPRDENYPLYMFHDRRFRPDIVGDIEVQPLPRQGAVSHAGFDCIALAACEGVEKLDGKTCGYRGGNHDQR